MKTLDGSVMYGARRVPKACSVAGDVLPTIMGTSGGYCAGDRSGCCCCRRRWM